MITELDIVLGPKDASEEKYYKPILAQKLGLKSGRIQEIKILRKSIDARQRNVKVNLRFRIAIDEQMLQSPDSEFFYSDVQNKPKVIVVGARLVYLLLFD